MNEHSLIAKKRAAIVTNNLHCERNMQYFATIEYYFRVNGWVVAEDFNVNLVVICGCGFHDSMYEKAMKVIEDLRKIHFLEKNVVIMGCLPKTHEQELLKNPGSTVIEIQKEEALDEIIGATIPFREISPVNLFKPHIKCREYIKENGFFYIKIAQGCLKKCSYCVIKKAKGYLTSVPLDQIENQFRKAIGSGYRKIFLMGEDTFAYGIDIGTTIIDLLDYLLKIDPMIELKIGYLHNRWLTKYSDEILSLCRRGVLNELHIGLQHTNENLLEKMGRPVNFSILYNTICRIKQERPDFYFITDIIVGFPGETEEMFDELIEFFKNDRCFDKVCHFAYSGVKGASSCDFDNKVPPEVKALRWEKLDQTLGSRSISRQPENPKRLDDVTYKVALLDNYVFCKDMIKDEIIENETIASQDLEAATADILKENREDFKF
jgi:ribosomal protein S12 methylthiotransferase